MNRQPGRKLQPVIAMLCWYTGWRWLEYYCSDVIYLREQTSGKSHSQDVVFQVIFPNFKNIQDVQR